jgi:hypothetical protein
VVTGLYGADEAGCWEREPVLNGWTPADVSHREPRAPRHHQT